MKYQKWYVSTRTGWMAYEKTEPTRNYAEALEEYDLRRHVNPKQKHLLIRIDVVETSQIAKVSKEDIRP